MAFMAFQSLLALPLHKDIDNQQLLRLPSSSNTSVTTTTTVTPATTETVLRSIETTAAATTTTTESPVSDLLSAIFRQTIYSRIESLLLDPGKKSDEKQKIVDSAVSNYHRQKMFDGDDNNNDDDEANSSDNNVSVESVTKEDSNDISKSTG